MDDKELRDILIAIGEVITANIRAELAAINLQDSRIIDSIDYKVQVPYIQIEIADYAKYIEHGRLPGKYVPIKPLIDWIKRKGIQGRNKKGRFISVNSLVFAISASIKRRGIKARPFIKKAIDNSQKEIAKIVELNLQEILDDTINEIINFKRTKK